MNEFEPFLLLDAAVITGSELAASISENAKVIGLYSDLSKEAIAVSPMLWPSRDLESISTSAVTLPFRFGISELRCTCKQDELIEHWRRYRYVDTSEGLSFFLRFADMRVTTALWSVLSASQRNALLGPIEEWRWIDRYGEPQRLMASSITSGHSAATDRLRLTAAQKDGLNNALWPDRLSIDLVELEQEGLRPDIQPEQFRFIERAAQWLTDRKIRSFRLARAVARQSVLSQGRLLDDAAFTSAVLGANTASRDNRQIDAWTFS